MRKEILAGWITLAIIIAIAALVMLATFFPVAIGLVAEICGGIAIVAFLIFLISACLDICIR